MKTTTERAAIMFNYKNDFQAFMRIAEQQLTEYAQDKVNELNKSDVNGELPLCYHHYEARDTQWMTCIKCGDIKPIISGNFR